MLREKDFNKKKKKKLEKSKKKIEGKGKKGNIKWKRKLYSHGKLGSFAYLSPIIAALGVANSKKSFLGYL